MSNSEPLPTKQVSCEICMREIPASEAKSEEAAEYVYYFCGAECFDSWSKQETEESDPPV